jgi:hypothetical protein
LVSGQRAVKEGAVMVVAIWVTTADADAIKEYISHSLAGIA